MNSERLQQFHDLAVTKRELDEQLKLVNAKIAALKHDLLEEIPGWSVQPPYHIDGDVIYLSGTVRAKLKGERGAAELALKRAGLEDLLTYSFNLNTVSGWMRSQLDAEEAIPAEVLEQFEVIEDFDLRVKKG